MLFRNVTKPSYAEAVAASDLVTKRLICINRQLAQDPLTCDPLSETVRQKVGAALDEHITNCETRSVA